MSNLYRETAGPAIALPVFDADANTEVAVVGAGFTGLSTALHLAERGIAVRLFDAQEPGWGASGRNGGQVNPGLKPDPETVERDFGEDLGARMNALAGTAPGLVFDLIARHRMDCEARRNGTLRAATRPRQAERLRATAAQFAARGAPVQVLQGEALERATGHRHYLSALLDRRGGDLHPLKFARGLARAALAAGAVLHADSRVSCVERAVGHWRLHVNGATATARQVVIATNGYTDDLWPGLRRTLVPVFGAIAATAPLSAAMAQAILPQRAALFEIGAITVYCRVDADQRLLIGGRGPMREVVEPRSLAHLARYARRLWPALEHVPFTHAWGGRLAMTRDHYPHVHEPADGILICLGYNGRGVAMATAMGEQLARRIVDPAGAFDMPITGPRAIPLHGLWPFGVRAAILKGRLADALG
jgi:glycine/D-amino acid oxidase-like deaminating enzyme